MGRKSPTFEANSTDTGRSGGSFPREAETVDDLEAHESPFLRLFSPRSKAAIVDALLSAGGEPKTVSELSEMNEHVTSSSFNRHRDDLEAYGLLEQDGKRGNARVYSINTSHPLAQSLKMVENVILYGKTPMVLDEEYVGEPDENVDSE